MKHDLFQLKLASTENTRNMNVSLRTLCVLHVLWIVTPVSSMRLQGLMTRPDLNGMEIMHDKSDLSGIEINWKTKSFQIPVRELRKRNTSLTNGDPFVVNLDNILFESIAGSQGIPGDCLDLLCDTIRWMPLSEIKLNAKAQYGSTLRRLAVSVAPYVGTFGLGLGNSGDPIDKHFLLVNLMEGIVVNNRAFHKRIKLDRIKQVMKRTNSSLEMQRIVVEYLHDMTVKELFKFKWGLRELFAITHSNAGGELKGLQCLMDISRSVPVQGGKRKIVISIIDWFLEEMKETPPTPNAQSSGTRANFTKCTESLPL